MPFKALSHLLLAANVSAETTKVGTWDKEGFYTKQAIVAGEGVSAQGARIAIPSHHAVWSHFQVVSWMPGWLSLLITSGFCFFSGEELGGNRSRCFQARASGGDLQTSKPCVASWPGRPERQGRGGALSPKG